jgi:hypothetical protein
MKRNLKMRARNLSYDGLVHAVVDGGHLLCPTPKGWYKYARTLVADGVADHVDAPLTCLTCIAMEPQ